MSDGYGSRFLHEGTGTLRTRRSRDCSGELIEGYVTPTRRLTISLGVQRTIIVGVRMELCRSCSTGHPGPRSEQARWIRRNGCPGLVGTEPVLTFHARLDERAHETQPSNSGS